MLSIKSLTVSAGILLASSVSYAQTPEEWANQRAAEIMQAPLTIEGATATSWYMIPERDLRTHNVDPD